MSPHIDVSADGPLLELRINRPEKKNALTGPMFAALAEALTQADADLAIRAVLVTGAADTFTAGADLREFLAQPPREPDHPVPVFLHVLSRMETPLIAAVTGLAVGIGTTLLLHCDLVVAGRSSRFLLPFVDLALVPEAGSSLLLPALIGRRLAFEHLVLCEPFDAETALRYGLANRVVDDADVLATARALARRVAEKPAQAVRLSKRLLTTGAPSVGERIDEETRAFAEQLRTAEFADAVARVLGKKE